MGLQRGREGPGPVLFALKTLLFHGIMQLGPGNLNKRRQINCELIPN